MGKERKFCNCSNFQPGKWVGSSLEALGWSFPPLCRPGAGEMCRPGRWAGAEGQAEQRRDLGGSPLPVYF